MYDEYGNITREKIGCPIGYEKIKEALKNNLIYHKPEQRLITSKINRIKKHKKDKNESSVLKQKTYSVRGSLVGDNFYGKLKNPKHQGIDKENAFVKRVNLTGENFKDIKSLDKIVDKNVKEILKRRLENTTYSGKGEKAFSEEALANDPVYLYSLNKYPESLKETPVSKKEKPLPIIKKVRIVNKNSRNLIPIPALSEEKNELGKRVIVNENRYAETDGNYVMALYEGKDEKGKIKRDFEILSFYKAVERKRSGEQLFPDEKLQKDGSSIGLMKKCPYLKQGDMALMYENTEDEINWSDTEDLKKRLYKVSELGLDYRSEKEQYGTLKFIKHNTQKMPKDSYTKEGDFIKRLHTGVNMIKVKLNNLGKIIKIDE
jgi:CRISPR-associated endonuclease Csn1